MIYLKPVTKALAFVVLSAITLSCSRTEERNAEGLFQAHEQHLSDNKAVVKEFVEAMRLSNVDKLKTMITDDFSWWIIGKPEYLVTAGEHDTEYFLGFFKGDELFPEGADFKTTSMISEGNVVAAEAEFKAMTAMGTQYENYYHFLFEIEDGKVKRMKEYMDTYHAKTTFGL